MVIAIPSLSNGQGVARTPREGDPDDHPVRAGRSITLHNGRAQFQTHANDQRTSDRNVQAATNRTVEPTIWAPPILTGSYVRCALARIASTTSDLASA